MRDEEFSKAVCKKLEVPFTVFHYDVPQIAKEEKLSLEEAGRNVRREAFEKAMKNIKVSGRKRIALAHHENDNAETVLHNLMRGSGAAGLGEYVPYQEKVKYIRPLLFVKRAELEKYLKEQEMSWVTDSTNEETEYTRNKIRHQIIPVMEEINPQAVTCIGRAAENMWKIEEYLQEQTDILYGRYVKETEDTFCIAKRVLFRKRNYAVLFDYACFREGVKGEKEYNSSTYRSSKRSFKGRTGASVSLAWG